MDFFVLIKAAILLPSVVFTIVMPIVCGMLIESSFAKEGDNRPHQGIGIAGGLVVLFISVASWTKGGDSDFHLKTDITTAVHHLMGLGDEYLVWLVLVTPIAICLLTIAIFRILRKREVMAL